MMHTFWNCRFLLVSSPIRSDRDHFPQADFPLLIRPNPLNPVLDNLRVGDHHGPIDGSIESARQVESLQRIARFSSSRITSECDLKGESKYRNKFQFGRLSFFKNAA
jgi:hypothetical protein